MVACEGDSVRELVVDGFKHSSLVRVSHFRESLSSAAAFKDASATHTSSQKESFRVTGA